MAVTTWNTAPNYDTWGFDTKWTCDDWIQWHRLLLAKFGKDKATILWNYAFSLSGQFSENLNCRTFNSSFRKYFQENGLDPYANAGVFSVVLNGFGTATDIASNTLGVASKITSGDWLKKATTIALIGGVAIGAFYIYNKTQK